MSFLSDRPVDDELRTKEFVVKGFVICLAGAFFQESQQEPGSFFALLIRELFYGCDGCVIHIEASGFVGKADDADIVGRVFGILDSVEGDIVVKGDDGVWCRF